jgi:hypothetical protein
VSVTDPRTEAVKKAAHGIHSERKFIAAIGENNSESEYCQRLAIKALDAIDYSATLTALADARRENERLWEALGSWKADHIKVMARCTQEGRALIGIAQYDKRWYGQRSNDMPSREQLIAKAFDALDALVALSADGEETDV